MNYTVKQLADKLEVTKATITNNAKALDLELKKIDNVIQIDDKQAVLISQRINKNKQANSMINKNPEDVSVSGSQTEEKDSRNDDLVEILKQQIEDLKKDKDEYINQVNNLNGLLKQQQTLLSQQQSLQLQSNEKIKSLEIELKEIKEDVENNGSSFATKAILYSQDRATGGKTLTFNRKSAFDKDFKDVAFSLQDNRIIITLPSKIRLSILSIFFLSYSSPPSLFFMSSFLKPPNPYNID